MLFISPEGIKARILVTFSRQQRSLRNPPAIESVEIAWQKKAQS